MEGMWKMLLQSITSCTSSPLLGRFDKFRTNLSYTFSITVFPYLLIALISRGLFPWEKFLLRSEEIISRTCKGDVVRAAYESIVANQSPQEQIHGFILRSNGFFVTIPVSVIV